MIFNPLDVRGVGIHHETEGPILMLPSAQDSISRRRIESVVLHADVNTLTRLAHRGILAFTTTTALAPATIQHLDIAAETRIKLGALSRTQIQLTFTRGTIPFTFNSVPTDARLVHEKRRQR